MAEAKYSKKRNMEEREARSVRQGNVQNPRKEFSFCGKALLSD